MKKGDDPVRYTNIAIFLHWLIALFILALLILGFVMVNAPLAPMDQFTYYQLHKSLGITVLLLVVLRIAWRLGHRPPPLPEDMPRLERQAASANHIGLYVLMVFLPLTGWMLVSASTFNIPTVLYGHIPWPHLPILPHLENKKEAEDILKNIHLYGALIVTGLILLHIAAAIRHQISKQDNILSRILPKKMF